MKKKIIISIYDDVDNPYYGGGGALVVDKLAKKLSSSYDVTVLTGNYPGARNEQKNGVWYQRVGLSLSPKIAQLLFPFWLYFYALTKSYDIWMESFNPPFSVSLLPLLTKKRVIGLVQMLASEDMKRKYRLPFHFIESWGIKLYSVLIVLSDNSKQKVVKMNPRASVSVIPLGVDDISVPKNTTGKYVLFLGRIEYDQKGIDLLISAYQRVATYSKVPLVIAGSGISADVHKLKESITKSGLKDRVEYIGKVSGSDKDRLLRKAVCVVIPSRFETFGLVGLEALSYGKPLIVFDIEGLQWIPENCALKVLSFDTQELGDRILQILADKSLQNQLSVNGLQFSEQFLWKNVVKKYEKVIKKTLRQ